MRTLVRNGRAALPDRLLDADVLVQDGRIAAVGRLGDVPADRVLDASGCYVLPGLMDFHTHVDDQIGRFYLADTYESGTRAALLSGITTLCTFVTQGAGESLPTAMARARGKAEGHCHCDVLWHLTPTTFEPADLRALQTLVAAGYRTLKLYTTYKAAGIFASYRRIGELFGRLGPLGAPFPGPLRGRRGHRRGGSGPAWTWPRPAATPCCARRRRRWWPSSRVVDLALAAPGGPARGARVHRRRGLDPGVRPAPGRPDLRDLPPVPACWTTPGWRGRTATTGCARRPCVPARSGCAQMVRAGAADIIATDHCAFRPQDKDDWDHTDLRSVPNGLPGVGALPHVTWKIWEEDPDRAALGLATHLALNPARRAGVQDRKGALLPGLDGDVVVLDPAGPERPLHSTLVPAFEAFPGFTSRLSFRHVLLRGEPRVQDGLLTGPRRPGRSAPAAFRRNPLLPSETSLPPGVRHAHRRRKPQDPSSP